MEGCNWDILYERINKNKKIKNQKVNLILYLLSMIIVGSPARPTTCLTTAYWLYNGARYRLYLVDQELNPIIKDLASPMTCIPLL